MAAPVVSGAAAMVSRALRTSPIYGFSSNDGLLPLMFLALDTSGTAVSAPPEPRQVA